MLITRRSPLTGKVHEIDLPITPEQFNRYTSGDLIQDAFPHLSAGMREFIMTGITPAEWNTQFGEWDNPNPNVMALDLYDNDTFTALDILRTVKPNSIKHI